MPSTPRTAPAQPVLATAPAGPAAWDIDPSHTTAGFSVKHLMIATVTGRFTRVAGSLTLDDAAPEQAVVEARIEAGSIDTGVADRDTHLRSADFFDADAHPVLTFRSTRIEGVGPDAADVHGELTIRGTTRPAVLKVALDGEVRDPWGKTRRAYTAETTISRKEFGLTWNQLLEAGGVAVGDKVRITLHVQVVRRE